MGVKSKVSNWNQSLTHCESNYPGVTWIQRYSSWYCFFFVPFFFHDKKLNWKKFQTVYVMKKYITRVRGIVTRELKHQTFLIYVRHASPPAELDQGRALRAKCKSLSKTTWNHHERRQNNSDECISKICVKFCFFFTKKTWFQKKNFYFLYEAYSSKNPEFEPLRVLKSVTAAQECIDIRSGCHAAKILPVGVRGIKNVWCSSSLLIYAEPLSISTL